MSDIDPSSEDLLEDHELFDHATWLGGDEAGQERAPTLFEAPRYVEEIWEGMPSFDHRELRAQQRVIVHLRNDEDRRAFSELIGQQILPTTKSVWHPALEKVSNTDKYWASDTPMNPRYPVYVISKGRADSRRTSKALERMGVPYRIVIEPQEYDAYAAVIDSAKIITLPFSNLGQGSIPARNFVFGHSIAEGAVRHWILDDNILGFHRYHQNLKVPVRDGTIFRAAEDFTDRWANVAQSGFNYFMFVVRKAGSIRPMTLNTRIYSCILNNNEIPHRWRGRYNEDTDLSIRVLKDGWCTILFNAFLADKMTTMYMAGGNTDELYAGDGRLKMAESLREQHPDCVEITEKWGRPQHSVNYRHFRHNKLVPNAAQPEQLGEYGMRIHYV